MIRFTVEDRHGTATVSVPLPDDDRLDDLIDKALAELADLGCPDPAGYLMAALTRIAADSAAYQREAARRGVLGL